MAHVKIGRAQLYGRCRTLQHGENGVCDPLVSIQRVLDNVNTVLVGKDEVIRLCLVALISKGHVLLEDVPGVGKTLLVRALARSLGCDYKRISFTPDLLPADVTGTDIYNREREQFEFRPGPIFAQIVLADEINRTSPRTQSALLEALEERTVSCDGVTHQLPTPFFVLATQNPMEYIGTYSLPESQLDRFLMKLSLGYPDASEERAVLMRGIDGTGVDILQPVVSSNEVISWQKEVEKIIVSEHIYGYLVNLLQSTRTHPALLLGVSPRGGVAMIKAARALAWMEGRAFVIPDDIKRLVVPVFSHRILLHSKALMEGRDAQSVILQIASETAVPVPAV